jgi:hypothetical protein
VFLYHQGKSTATFRFGIKNAGCIQHSMWMWQGLFWTKPSIYPN